MQYRMREVRRNVGQWNEGKPALVQKWVGERQRRRLPDKLIVIQQVDVYRARPPVFMPHPPKFRLNCLCLRKDHFRFQRCFDGQHLIQKRRLIGYAPRCGLVQVRLTDDPPDSLLNSRYRLRQRSHAIPKIGTEKEKGCHELSD